MTAYTTKTDAIAYYILPALGKYSNDYDLDGIFSEFFAYDESEQGFVPTDEDLFWEIVENHAR